MFLWQFVYKKIIFGEKLDLSALSHVAFDCAKTLKFSLFHNLLVSYYKKAQLMLLHELKYVRSRLSRIVVRLFGRQLLFDTRLGAGSVSVDFAILVVVHDLLRVDCVEQVLTGEL